MGNQSYWTKNFNNQVGITKGHVVLIGNHWWNMV
jgi:hypothetical protein